MGRTRIYPPARAAAGSSPRGVRLSFRHPSGVSDRLHAPDALKDLILRTPDPAYWKTGSGDALIGYQAPGRRAELALMCKLRHGFILTHTFEKDRREPLHDTYVSTKGAKGRSFRRKTSLFIGGDFYRFPVAYFIDRRRAWEAVVHFCRTGGRSDAVAWVRKIDVRAFEPDEEICGTHY